MKNEESITPGKINNLLSAAESLLLAREKLFLESILHQLSQPGFSLSWSQENWLNKILAKYSPERLKEEEEWTRGFDLNKRLIALRVARYYERNPPYFAHYISRVLSDQDNFIFSKREWDKFCENKYALKVRENYESPPKFSKADCIQIRSSNRIDLANWYNESHTSPNRAACRKLKNKIGFILEADAKPVTRAAKGSRIYRILLTGEVSPIYAHESDLKRKRL